MRVPHRRLDARVPEYRHEVPDVVVPDHVPARKRVPEPMKRNLGHASSPDTRLEELVRYP